MDAQAYTDRNRKVDLKLRAWKNFCKVCGSLTCPFNIGRCSLNVLQTPYNSYKCFFLGGFCPSIYIMDICPFSGKQSALCLDDLDFSEWLPGSPDLLLYCSNDAARKKIRVEPGASGQVPHDGYTYNVIYYRQVHLFLVHSLNLLILYLAGRFYSATTFASLNRLKITL